MSTFTAVALDRLLESGESKSVNKSGYDSKSPLSPTSKLRRRNGASVTERKVNCPEISPATPESTPLPDSPSFFPSSPYIVNHKRRGPHLSWSSSEVVFQKRSVEEEKHRNVDQAKVHGGSSQDERRNGESRSCDGEVGSCLMSDGFANGGAAMKVGPLNSDRCGDGEDFFDLNESSNVTSNTEGDDPSGVEFYDAWDELSSDSASAVCDVEAELREIKSSLLVEIENRKQAEEDLNKMRCKWQRTSQELAFVGLSLPADPENATDDELVKPAEELRQKERVARFVSLSVGRGIARAEMQTEMESLIESKNFEIVRLLDRLHYYETVNREMSQRNQEAIEMARRDRQRKKRRQRLVWGSIVAAITLGTAALAISYMPTGKGQSASSASAPGSDDAAAAAM